MVKLSIVIPYYRTYELTTQLLGTLVPQLNNDVEVILIDDGCNEKRLDKYKESIRIIHLKENIGGAGASNKGIEKAKGQYIGFVDSDDMIAEDYIKTLVEAIDTHNEEVIYMGWKDINTGVTTLRPDNYAQWKAIYKKEIIPRFPEGRRYSYDVPFYDELKQKGHTKHYIEKVLYFYNSNREGCLSLEKKKIIEMEKKQW